MNGTNDLIQQGNGAMALSERHELIAAEVAEEAERTAFDFQPTRIKLPSGGLTVFTMSDGGTLPPFTGIIAVSQKGRAYWPEGDTMGQPPLCASPDALEGWLNEAASTDQLRADQMRGIRHPAVEYFPNHLGPHTCAKCPLSGWGSGEGRGQACKAMRRLLILVDGWRMPALLTLPPTSVRIFDQFASARASRGEAYFSCRTRFELEQRKSGQGIAYSAVKLSVLDELGQDDLVEVLAIRAQFAELVRSMAITAEEYEAVSEEQVPF